MTEANPAPRYFAVTTSGLTATRWLSHVLASHPDVFVAHGKFALDSVEAGTFLKEKGTANLASLTRGNQTRAFYESRPLEEVLALYRGIKPGARAYGCVHSYTMHTLAQAAQKAETLDRIRVINVVRHPINFLASHEALVRGAEKHPALYQFYLDEVFPNVLAQFPELFLLKCRDFRSFLAFALSCHAVNNFLFDMCYPGLPLLKMEALTTQVEVLAEFCRDLTGLAYPSEKLEEFIQLGAINQHRPGKPKKHRETYDAWEPWQKDMAQVMISPLVLDWFESLGYDLSSLREPPVGINAMSEIPCLADYLRSLDHKHPLLVYMTPTGTNRCQIVESDYHGFHLVRRQEQFTALANSLGIRDIEYLNEENLKDLQEDGLCVRGHSLGQIWHALAQVVSSNPRLIEEYRRYNLIAFRGVCYAAKSGVHINLERMRSPERKQLFKENKLFAGANLAIVKGQIDANENHQNA